MIHRNMGWVIMCGFLFLNSNIWTLNASIIDLRHFTKVPPGGLILGQLDQVMGQRSTMEIILRYVTNFIEDDIYPLSCPILT